MTSQHKFKPETTNGGACFADCACGWTGGVHPSRPRAREAWAAHRDGGERVEPINPTFLIGGPARGMSDGGPA